MYVDYLLGPLEVGSQPAIPEWINKLYDRGPRSGYRANHYLGSPATARATTHWAPPTVERPWQVKIRVSWSLLSFGRDRLDYLSQFEFLLSERWVKDGLTALSE